MYENANLLIYIFHAPFGRHASDARLIAGIAGNLTITGSIANIIVVEGARDEVKIGFKDYLRAGVPVTMLTLALGTFWLSFVG